MLLFRNTSVESYYAYSDDRIDQGYYYLNNFNNIFISGGMLFNSFILDFKKQLWLFLYISLSKSLIIIH